MATTCRQLITQSLKKLQVIAADQTPEAADMVDSLEAFNGLMHGLDLSGIGFDWRTLTTDDTIPLPDKHMRGVMYLLAVELAPNYGREVDPAVATFAQEARTFLQTAYTDIPRQTFDPAFPSRIEQSDYDIATE